MVFFCYKFYLPCRQAGKWDIRIFLLLKNNLLSQVTSFFVIPAVFSFRENGEGIPACLASQPACQVERGGQSESVSGRQN